MIAEYLDIDCTSRGLLAVPVRYKGQRLAVINKTRDVSCRVKTCMVIDGLACNHASADCSGQSVEARVECRVAYEGAVLS
jgi:hypothetical protein